MSTEKYVDHVVLKNGHELKRDANGNWFLWVGGERKKRMSAFEVDMIDACIRSGLGYKK